MEKLINELVAKVGLSPETAQQASKVVLDFVKTKLPAGLSDKAEDLLNGNLDFSAILAQLTQGDKTNEGGLGGLLDKAKDIFGGKQ